MEALQTARVLVLDDQPSEAMPVVHALSMLGIGVVYHDGSDGFMSGMKLQGIRVLFLDMVLKALGADESDPKQCAGIVVGALSGVLDPGDDPLVAICWTAHKDILPAFDRAFTESFPRNKQSSIMLLEKPASDFFHTPENLKMITDAIGTALEKIPPVKALFAWEQMVHDSATSTTRLLNHLVAGYQDDGRGDWSVHTLNILAALAIAERGMRVPDENNMQAIGAVYSALNPVLVDALEHLQPRAGTELDSVAEGVRDQAALERKEQKENNGSLIPFEIQAKLNSVMNIADHTAEGGVAPGCLYLMTPRSDNFKLLGTALPGLKMLTELLDDTFFQAEGFPRGKALWELCTPVLLEFSPPCDFAQDKSKIHRFVAGFILFGDVLLRSEFSREGAAYIKKSGPFYLPKDVEEDDQISYLVLNSHYIFGITPDHARSFQPYRRLRKEAATDVNYWLASQIGRPGPMRIEPLSRKH